MQISYSSDWVYIGAPDDEVFQSTMSVIQAAGATGRFLHNTSDQFQLVKGFEAESPSFINIYPVPIVQPGVVGDAYIKVCMSCSAKWNANYSSSSFGQSTCCQQSINQSLMFP